MARHINAAIAGCGDIARQLPYIDNPRIGKTVSQAFADKTGRQVKLRHALGKGAATINSGVVEAENAIADFTLMAR